MENSENGSKLTILAARQEHCGCYTLLVENKLGSRQAQVNLTVVGESVCSRLGVWRWGRGSRALSGQVINLEWGGGGVCQGALPLSPCSHAVAVLHARIQTPAQPLPQHTHTASSSAYESPPCFSFFLAFETLSFPTPRPLLLAPVTPLPLPPP